MIKLSKSGLPRVAALRTNLLRLAGASTLVLVASCASTPATQSFGPSGKLAFASQCSQFAYSLNECYQKAAYPCAHGYTRLDDVAGTVGVPTRGGIMTTPHYKVAVECK